MNPTANNIKQRLSLREPLVKALDVVVRLTDTLSLSKPEPGTLDEFIKSELAKAQTVCPLCKDFERDFPSFAFSIATGIGTGEGRRRQGIAGHRGGDAIKHQRGKDGTNYLEQHVHAAVFATHAAAEKDTQTDGRIDVAA